MCRQTGWRDEGIFNKKKSWKIKTISRAELVKRRRRIEFKYEQILNDHFISLSAEVKESAVEVTQIEYPIQFA